MSEGVYIIIIVKDGMAAAIPSSVCQKTQFQYFPRTCASEKIPFVAQVGPAGAMQASSRRYAAALSES